MASKQPVKLYLSLNHTQPHWKSKDAIWLEYTKIGIQIVNLKWRETVHSFQIWIPILKDFTFEAKRGLIDGQG